MRMLPTHKAAFDPPTATATTRSTRSIAIKAAGGRVVGTLRYAFRILAPILPAL